MKKEPLDNNALVLKRNKELRQQYTSPLIKWFQASMTMDEKFKFGMISYQEYAQWQAEHPEGEEKLKVGAEETENVNHTFWEGDAGDRENISSDSYADFLSQNGVNVANKNTVDFDALLSQTESDQSENDAVENEADPPEGEEEQIESVEEFPAGEEEQVESIEESPDDKGEQVESVEESPETIEEQAE